MKPFHKTLLFLIAVVLVFVSLYFANGYQENPYEDITLEEVLYIGKVTDQILLVGEINSLAIKNGTLTNVYGKEIRKEKDWKDETQKWFDITKEQASIELTAPTERFKPLEKKYKKVMNKYLDDVELMEKVIFQQDKEAKISFLHGQSNVSFLVQEVHTEMKKFKQ
ncbi:hypothetical protein [Psychrobacillus sp. FSL K6-1464]|uniref:hypothetical protein n=1 Tax=Psychrobacillus sp. FSL K6-1464 TaxID=2921545 RepID=UPI0030F78663